MSEQVDVFVAFNLGLRRQEATNICNVLFHILGLDKSIEQQLLVAKRNCLRLLQVQEFSKEAMFMDMTRKVVLKDVTCKSCWFVSDMDVSRDSRIHENKHAWTCEACEEEFNMFEIEHCLVKQLEKLIRMFLQSDLKCNKCGLVRNDYCSEYCVCSGPWTIEVSVCVDGTPECQLNSVLPDDSVRNQEELGRLSNSCRILRL